jgi:hypothetical protein
LGRLSKEKEEASVCFWRECSLSRANVL